MITIILNLHLHVYIYIYIHFINFVFHVGGNKLSSIYMISLFVKKEDKINVK